VRAPAAAEPDADLDWPDSEFQADGLVTADEDRGLWSRKAAGVDVTLRNPMGDRRTVSEHLVIPAYVTSPPSGSLTSSRRSALMTSTSLETEPCRTRQSELNCAGRARIVLPRCSLEPQNMRISRGVRIQPRPMAQRSLQIDIFRPSPPRRCPARPADEMPGEGASTGAPAAPALVAEAVVPRSPSPALAADDLRWSRRGARRFAGR
jgi:hypothetical protein